MSGALGRIKELIALLRGTRLGRAFSRYSTANGPLLAGGIAYTGLFSAFAALTVGVSILMAALKDHARLRAAVLDVIEDALPGVVDDGSGAALVSVDQLTANSILNTGSVLGSAVLLYTAMSLMGTLKSAMRAMFGIVRLPRNPVVAQLANLAGFVVVVVGVLATAAGSLATAAVSASLVETVEWIPAWLSAPGTRALTLVVSGLIDALVLAAIVSLGGIRPPWRDLVGGCAMGAIALTALREAGARAVGSAGDNPLLASAAALAALVLWLHMASRIILLAAAWTANPPQPQAIEHPAEVHARERPNYVTVSVPETLEWPRLSLTGAVEVDPEAHPERAAADHAGPGDAEPGDAGAAAAEPGDAGAAAAEPGDAAGAGDEGGAGTGAPCGQPAGPSSSLSP